MQYEAIIGVEVHAQILTASKMFCRCSADIAHAAPNTHTCPVCLGMPGVLPVINQAAVEATILTGMALNCTIPPFSKFDRKNYHYPDLPKGYQISQYDYPLCTGGYLDVELDGTTRRLGIRRVHLEEDTARLVHEGGVSLVDFNRSSVPLMEIVSEADMRSTDDTYAYLVKLRQILRYLGVSTGNMEEGAMRCEANISVRPVGAQEFGVKVEVKNLNSFRSVRLAIAYEIERQVRVIEEGGRVHQVTMGWDENRLCTVFQRSKEYADDYRYFPDPDLPPLEIDEARRQAIAARLPELPDARRERFVSDYRLRQEDARLLTEDRATADYYEAGVGAAQGRVAPQIVSNWILGELFRLLGESGQEIGQCRVRPEGLIELLDLLQEGAINATVAKEVLEEMFASGAAAKAIVQARGLTQINDQDALAAAVRDALAAHPGPVQQYLDGKQQVLGFLIGQVMRATRGQANVQIVTELLREELSRLG
jgi:aspartyl-tRNA(Asn)/glutamyl-tRNA(Gln) amidotransferase subunit B